MAGDLRPAQAINALRRLGYTDVPGSGDHVQLYKHLPNHPDGPTTIRTGIDMGQNPVSKHDQARIRRQTKLSTKQFDAALRKKLSLDEYDALLHGIPKEDLVISWWKQKVIEDKRKRAKGGREPS